MVLSRPFKKYSILALIFGIAFICLNSKFLMKKLSLQQKNKRLATEMINFNKSTDLVAFLHIEKTGGTNFELVLMRYLEKFNTMSNVWENACLLKPKIHTTYARYYCSRDNLNTYNYETLSINNSWFLGRQTYAWAKNWKCDVHSDFAKFKQCTRKIMLENSFLKKIHYITIIRDPVQRYISEWAHVSRKTRNDVSFKFNSKNVCNREVNCLPEFNKENITLEQFILCKNNMAGNRQTRLLASYDQINNNNCSLFKPENKKLLLENAKNVLKKMSFFALTEYDDLSRSLFEKTFKNFFRFKEIKEPKPKQKTYDFIKTLDINLLEKIRKINDLDLELYDLAKKLFREKLKFYEIQNLRKRR